MKTHHPTLLLSYGLTLHTARTVASASARPGPHIRPSNHRKLTPDDDIIQELNQQLASGVAHPRFTLTANFAGVDFFTGPEPLEFDVVMTNPSVDEATTFSVEDGPIKPVNSTVKYLISDQSTSSDPFLKGTKNYFSLLVVDELNGSVKGIVQKDDKLMRLEQVEGGSAIVTEVSFEPPRDWKCSIQEKERKESHHGEARHLSHDHDHDVDLRNLSSHVQNINPSDKHRRRRLYLTDDFPNKWSYQIDIFMEVDTAFVNFHDPNDSTNMPNTIAYVNALVTASSAVYEKEIDTHLHVIHIKKTSRYDSTSTTSQALDAMEAYYSSTTWHFTHPTTGQVPDTHHALIYKSIGGGRAGLEVLCDPEYAYGVTGSMKGSIDDLGGEMFWDISSFMHELGHNFGSGHTHESAYYSPVIDNCGNDNCKSPVTGSTIQKGEATIMSYCHLCSGSESNIGYTFGGHWIGGDRSNVAHWEDNEDAVPFNRDPRRVSKVMYEHVSSRGTCTDPYLPVPSQVCTVANAAIDCYDNNICTVDTCNGITGICSNELVSGQCCGNGICEPGESSCSDCGPFSLQTPDCDAYCYTQYGFMFDIRAKNDIIVTGLTFMLRYGYNDITIYTASGSFSTKSSSQGSWTEIFNDSYNEDSWTKVKVSFASVAVGAGLTRAFYISSTEKLVLDEASGSIYVEDENLAVLNPGIGLDSDFDGGDGFDYSFGNGAIEYSVVVPVMNTLVKI
ncbi:hypothetical protein ACHAW6_008855 [Cyclotella cf. meneghiniana]